MNEEKGEHFDPYLVDAFLSDMDAVRAIQHRLADKEEDFDKYRNIEQLRIEDLNISLLNFRSSES
jgi:hypothetical protein